MNCIVSKCIILRFIIFLHCRRESEPDTPGGNAVMPERDLLSEAFLCYQLVKMKPIASRLPERAMRF